MEKRKFDSNLKYHGWKQMNTILDKEMPEKKRRKGLIVLFALLLLLAFSVLVSDVAVKNKRKVNFNEKVLKPAEKPKIVYKKQNSKIYKELQKDNKTHLNEIIKKNIILNKSNTITNDVQKPKKKLNLKANTFAYTNLSDNLYSSSKLAKKQQEKINLTAIRETEKLQAIITKNIEDKKGKLDLAKIELLINNKKNSSIDLINPFFGAKAYAVSTEKRNLSLGFEIGNRLSYNRYFSDISISCNQTEIVFPQIVFYTDGSYNESFDNNSIKHSAYDTISSPYLSSWVLELNIDQGYWINKNINAELGLGIGFKKIGDSSPLSSKQSTNDLYEIFNKYTISSRIGLSYQVAGKLSFSLGYKHYFNSNYKLYYKQNKVYRAKITRKPIIAGLNIGVRLWL